jgi:hypothetical protein
MDRLLRWILILSGLSMVIAIVPMVMPLSWMEIGHRWLGLGEFPSQPIVPYLARTTSGLYAVLGALLLLAATDLRRYATMAVVVIVGIVVISLADFVFGRFEGMPLWWSADDLASAGALTLVAVPLLLLRRRANPT